MNIKKLFAVSAIVTFVGSTFLNGLALAATPDTELGKAYEWAYANGVTTMGTYEAANMTAPITRAEMAKMLSNYAKKFKGATADTSAACSFNDTASVGGDLAVAIVESCQLGIMGQGITNFRPYDTITRAEFGTALSRVLWDKAYEGGNPYYVKHLNALQSAGIMNVIANAESTKEIRGYVMLMLMRSAEGSESNTDCEDPMIKAACLLESDSCPAECKDEANEEEDNTAVKSGDLAVKANSNNGGVILAAGVSDMDTLTFKTSEEVEITKVVLERYGYSKNENVKRVWLEDENGTIISNEATSLNSKAQVTLTLKKDYRKVDGTLNATVVIEADADAGNTIGFKVVDVTSSAKNVDLGNYNPYTYSVVNYDGADLIITTRSADKTYNWEAGKSYEVAKFKLKAPSDSAVEVRSFTLTDANNNAIEYDDFLEDVVVTVAGKEVKSSYSVNKDDELVINLKDVELAAKDNSEFVVSIELSDGFDNMGKSVNFYIANSSNISATDAKTSSRVLVKALATYDSDTTDADGTKHKAGDHKDYTGAAKDWYTVKFEGGKVKITSTKLGNIEASEDSTDIVIAEGEITTSQTIKTNKGVIKVKVTNSNQKVVSAMRLEIAGDEYEGSFDSTTNTFSFPAIDVDRSGKIRILVDTVEKGTENDYATFTISGFKGTNTTTPDGFYYEDSKTLADIAGSLNISRLTLAPSKAALTNTMSSDEVEFKAGESSEEVTIFKGSYTAKKRDVYLNEFTLDGVSTAWLSAHNMTVYLYIGGEPVADADLTTSTNGWTAKDSFTNVLVKAGESVDVELKAQVDAASAVNASGEVDSTKLLSAKKFTLTLKGEDENGNSPAGTADRQTAKISVVAKGTAEVEAGKASKTVLLRGSNDAIAEFTVKPSGANSFDLESISFTKGSNVCTNLKLEGAVSEDFKDSTDGKKCIADGFVESINKDGETVRIVFDEEPAESEALITANIEGLEINGKSISNKFNKAYADAVIKFSQSNQTSYTKYTIESIKKYNGSTQISNLRFFADESAKDEFDLGLNSEDTLSEGDTFSIDNMTDSERIRAIKYTVTRGNFTQEVTVKYSDYSDYFKTTNNDDLRVYANGKDGENTKANRKNASDDE